MSYGNHEIGYLIKSNQMKVAAARLRKAIRNNDEHIVRTAKALGCGRGTIYRWIAALEDAGYEVR